ncbi:DNA-binding transcriptional regulator CytR [Escherichia coli]|nr:DNA-binding transcriptional regulator CytR [Escherichia coli]
MKAKKQETAATMKDVALKAKVSTATVSRALMNPDKVSQATRNRVEKAAREVGYLPQPMGRNVKRNESRTILVIVPDICDPFFSEIIRGIEVTAANHGYLVLIGDCAHQNQQEKTFIDLIITKQIDGMLLLGSRLPFDASIEEQRNLPPMVMANEFAPELELPTVHIDNLTGFAPIFPDICYHLTHYKPAAADIPVASDNPAHYADAIRYNARTPLQGSLLPLTRLVWA